MQWKCIRNIEKIITNHFVFICSANIPIYRETIQATRISKMSYIEWNIESTNGAECSRDISL